MSLKVVATAPSNIALIKYMGKKTFEKNIPTNASFSYTLDHLLTYVELETTDATQNSWRPLEHSDLLSNEENEALMEMSLSAAGKERFLSHLDRLRDHYDISQNFVVRSSNNFPSDCGLASSASSFAALTLAFREWIKAQNSDFNESLDSFVQLSRQASGSSCRSFYTPWVMWREREVQDYQLNLNSLLHQSIVVSGIKKEVSSSEAHKLVQSSELFNGRTERAENRLELLLQSLKHNDWRQAFEICWAEFWDMHALFETSNPSFGYMTAKSVSVLQQLKDIWREESDGPIVTMDAGPNIHLLYREDQKELAEKIEHLLKPQVQVISSY